MVHWCFLSRVWTPITLIPFTMLIVKLKSLASNQWFIVWTMSKVKSFENFKMEVDIQMAILKFRIFFDNICVIVWLNNRLLVNLDASISLASMIVFYVVRSIFQDLHRMDEKENQAFLILKVKVKVDWRWGIQFVSEPWDKIFKLQDVDF